MWQLKVRGSVSLSCFQLSLFSYGPPSLTCVTLLWQKLNTEGLCAAVVTVQTRHQVPEPGPRRCEEVACQSL